MKNLCVCLFLGLFAACVSPEVSTTSTRTRTYGTDERAIRMAICLARISDVKGEVWFVDESDEFIEELKKSSGVNSIRHVSGSRYDERKRRPADLRTGETGFVFSISNVAVVGDAATASVSWYASPFGGEWTTVSLKKQNGRWVIGKWKLDLVS